MKPRTFLQRLAAFAASVVIATTIVGSQLGLAHHYSAKAAAPQTAQRAGAPLAMPGTAQFPQKPG